MALTLELSLAFLAALSVILAIAFGASLLQRWQAPVTDWLKHSTEQSLADFLVYMPAAILWRRLGLLAITLTIVLSALFGLHAALIVTLAVVIAVPLGKGALLKRRQGVISQQLPSAIDMLVTATVAGLSFHSALERTTTQLKAPLKHEWQLILRRLRTGEDLTIVLLDFYSRTPTEAVLQLVLTIQLGIRHGAQQAHILARVAQSIRQQQYAVERVKSLSAQARMQGKVLLLLPIGLFAALHYLHPENTRILTETSMGKALLVICLILMMVGQLIVRKILVHAYEQ